MFFIFYFPFCLELRHDKLPSGPFFFFQQVPYFVWTLTDLGPFFLFGSPVGGIFFCLELLHSFFFPFRSYSKTDFLIFPFISISFLIFFFFLSAFSLNQEQGVKVYFSSFSPSNRKIYKPARV